MKANSLSIPGVAVVVAACFGSLAGCSTTAHVSRIDASAASIDEQARQTLGGFTKGVSGGRPIREQGDEVEVPFLAGDSIPLAPEVTLPYALRKGVNLAISVRAKNGVKTLNDVADAISESTGIPVRVRPDALLPSASFSPKGAQGQLSQSSGSDTLELPTQEAPLHHTLDLIAGKLNINWRFDGQAIEFYRMETRTFTLRGLPVKTTTTAGLGRNGGQAGAFDNSSATKLTGGEMDSVASAKATIDALMSKAGVGPVINTDTGTVIVTDTKENLDQIAKWVEVENRKMSRRVDLVFEVVQMTVKNNHNAAFDWNIVYKAVAEGGAGSSWTSPGSLATADSAALSIGARSGALAGSTLAIKSLAELGTIVHVDRFPLQTVNRRPASIAARTTFNYIDQVSSQSAASATNVVSTGPTVQQKEETVGAMLTVVPDVGDDGVIAMAITYDNTALTGLKPFTTGNGANQTTVQQKTIEGNGSLQQVVTRIGVPTVVAGIERTQQQYDKRRLGDDVPLLAGGSDSASETKNITVLVVTAVARDGV